MLSCYSFENTTKTWIEAEKHCQTLHPRSHLVAIETHAEQKFIMDFRNYNTGNYEGSRNLLRERMVDCCFVSNLILRNWMRQNQILVMSFSNHIYYIILKVKTNFLLANPRPFLGIYAATKHRLMHLASMIAIEWNLQFLSCACCFTVHNILSSIVTILSGHFTRFCL